MKPLQVTLSFSPADVNPSWLRNFYKALIANGIRIAGGYSPRDSTNPNQFGRALRESDAVLFLVGAQSMNSPFVAFEMGAALAQEKKLIPIAAGDLPKSRWPGPLRARRALPQRSAAATAAEVAVELGVTQNQAAAG
ncbi:MAG: toll/interleukin-1 receptor domain-containing protein [Phycisphaerales bacterium]|nr:toll/interleukin-1 receptor domain-containing protein [Phycisphaerales bacterium]